MSENEYGNFINPEKNNRYKEFLNAPVTNSMKSKILNDTVADSTSPKSKISESATATAPKNITASEGDKLHETQSLIGAVGETVSREVEKDLDKNGDELSDRSKNQVTKYGYKASKLTAQGAVAAGRETAALTKYGNILIGDVKAGKLSGLEAKNAMLSRIGQSFVEKTPSILKTAGAGAARAVEDFRGSEDLGMQSITKPKDAVFSTHRTIKAANTTGKTLTNGIKTTGKALSKGINTAYSSGRGIYLLGKSILSNPVILKATGAALCLILLISFICIIVTSIASILPSLSVKSESWDLTQTYGYITELDAKMEEQIMSEDEKIRIPPIDRYHYYYNGVAVPEVNMSVYTNADLLLMYFDSKYQDYSFDMVRDEIDRIHREIHSVKTKEWTTGKGIKKTRHLGVYLTSNNVDYYIKAHLTGDELENYKSLEEIGAYTMRTELASPFDADWVAHISCRFGWRIHPLKKTLDDHKAVDLAFPGGTPIKACMGGTVDVPHYSGSYGNYLKIIDSNGNYTLYAHMSSIAVKDGANVKIGDIIGYVGTTGSSNGNHLHLEYYKDGHYLNPALFLERK